MDEFEDEPAHTRVKHFYDRDENIWRVAIYNNTLHVTKLTHLPHVEPIQLREENGVIIIDDDDDD
jgi:hypothetical protein